MRRFLVFTVVLAAACCLAGCAPNGHEQTGSAVSAGPRVTTLDMKPEPMTVSPAITSQRQAQEALYGYMQKTLQGLPDGIFLDNKRYGGGGTAACDSERVDRENSPLSYSDFRDTHIPKGIDYNDLIAKVGELWRSWGWRVQEQASSYKPNWHGTSPDGYELSIMGYSGKFAGYPPALNGNTPCFPPNLRDDHVPIPTLISKDKLLYDEPSATPTR